MKKSFHIVTFGCQMNVRDSQWLAAILAQRGYEEAPLEEAAAIILNTCSVREKPEQKVKSFLKRAVAANPEALFGVMGCVAQQLGASLAQFCPQVRLVAGADGVTYVPDAIENLLRNRTNKVVLLDFEPDYPERALDCQTSPAPTAFVNIMQGCDNFCSYCIVPFTRGRQKSRGAYAVLEECRRRIREGSREIVLLGQNVNAWNGDEAGFPGLLKRVSELDGLARLRFVTSHPKDMDEGVIEAFAEKMVLCPSLHLPLQSGSDRILKAMRRGYDTKTYLRLVESLRKARPDLALATDLIVGFPGETEDDFRDTLAMVKACGFVSGFSFCYSDRPGTRASSMPGKIPHPLQLERLSRLQALLDSQTRSWLQSRVDQQTELLMTGRSGRGDSWQGRDPYGTVVNVFLQAGVNPVGEILKARITQAKRHTLLAELDGQN